MASNRLQRVLIVGGLGYVGSRLAHALSGDALVTVTSRSLSPSRERWLNQHFGQLTRVEFDSARHERLPVEGEFDYIVNAAAPGATEAARDEKTALEKALRTLNACLEIAASGRATRLVHFSTFHVYGAHNRQRFCEEDDPEPVNPYGRMHWQCERAATSETGAGVTVVRPTNIVGAPAHDDFGAQSGLVFLDLCRQSVQDHQIRLRTNGIAYRDFVPMADAIDAVRLLLAEDAGSDHANRVFNLSTGSAVRLDDLAYQIERESQEMLGREIPVRLGDEVDRFSDPFEVNNDRLRALGWKPRASLRDDIRETLRFFIRESAQ